MSLARNTLVQAALTLGSRVLGFARDLALANRFGQGPLMDAFATALMAPNLFRRLFAEGAFAQAFVPVYGRVRTEDGEAAAADTASQSLSFLLFVVAAFVIVVQLLMPLLMPWLLSAYRDKPDVLRLATIATQLAMPYLACMAVASLLSGVLNTAGRFALSAAVPALLNVCTLVPLVLIEERERALLATSAAVAVAGLLQAGLLWWGVQRLGVRLRIGWPQLSAVVRRVVVLAVPGAVAGGAMQINSLVSQVLTGSDAGARSVLYNADRLYQLPLGLVGVAIGLALVPRLTRSFVSGDEAGANATLDDGVALAMAFTLPAAAALFVMPYFVIDATVTRGAFTHGDAARTADVLRHFAWGIPAFVLAKVFTPPYFARQDMRRPMHFAMISVAVNVVLGASLYFGLDRLGMDGVVGLAVATSLAAWVNVLLLSGTLRREGVYRLQGAVAKRLLRMGAATALMAALLWACAANYERLSQLLWRKEVAVLVVTVAGLLTYTIAVLAFRAVTRAELRAALRREPGGGGGGSFEP
ncbi:MAG TPA: murein biosynthesis integral membrane protein MurJ [Caulobacteraceae bacterium]|jgi:putative peptidoglycan lipid II flippase